MMEFAPWQILYNEPFSILMFNATEFWCSRLTRSTACTAAGRPTWDEALLGFLI